MYGFANHPKWNKTLTPIAQLKTKITQIHNVRSGETVGYNCGWRAKKDTRIRFADHVKKVYDNKSILIVFGPEGGLARHEVDALVRCGASGVTLGPRILRAETAPLYALSALSYEFE